MCLHSPLRFLPTNTFSSCDCLPQPPPLDISPVVVLLAVFMTSPHHVHHRLNLRIAKVAVKFVKYDSVMLEYKEPSTAEPNPFERHDQTSEDMKTLDIPLLQRQTPTLTTQLEDI